MTSPKTVEKGENAAAIGASKASTERDFGVSLL